MAENWHSESGVGERGKEKKLSVAYTQLCMRNEMVSWELNDMVLVIGYFLSMYFLSSSVVVMCYIFDFQMSTLHSATPLKFLNTKLVFSYFCEALISKHLSRLVKVWKLLIRVSFPRHIRLSSRVPFNFLPDIPLQSIQFSDMAKKKVNFRGKKRLKFHSFYSTSWGERG